MTIEHHRAVWVYGARALVSNTSARADFIGFARQNGITDLFLSVPDGLLAEPALPETLSELSDCGSLRIEGMFGDPSWALSVTGREAMLSRVRALLDYNARATNEAQRFSGVHLDIEPWIGTGEDMSWVAPLIVTYCVAACALSDADITLTADLGGVKAARAALTERQAMLDAVGRIVLMQYEIKSLSLIEQRTDSFLDGLSIGDSQGVLIGFMSKDLPDVPSAGQTFDLAYANRNGYLGWSVFSYTAQ